MSNHVLIVGRSGSGKTVLCRDKLARYYDDNGVLVFVLDPFLDARWPASFITDNPEHFVEICEQNERAMLFVDEGGDMIGRYPGVISQVATRSRHRGHTAHIITQDHSQLAGSVRSQCVNIYAFRMSKLRGHKLADEYSQEALKQVHKLGKGECIAVEDFDTPYVLNVFEGSKRQFDLT